MPLNLLFCESDMRRYTRPMRRAILFLAMLSTALVLPLGSGAAPRGGTADSPARRDVTGNITVRLRYHTTWVTRLSLKLNKYKLVEFKVCGVWNSPANREFGCLGAGSRLPERTVLRMEQSPIAAAMKRADSPGWGMVGLSSDPVIRTPLSNTLTGDKYGTFYYRVTLRDLRGKVLLTSNKVTLVWHK
jgi:hypothetical protein